MMWMIGKILELSRGANRPHLASGEALLRAKLLKGNAVDLQSDVSQGAGIAFQPRADTETLEKVKRAKLMAVENKLSARLKSARW